MKFLYDHDTVTTLKSLCERDEPQLVRVIARLITHMVQSPEDMRLWLKFDSANLALNSAGTTNVIQVVGKPGKMPPDRGIFRNWGCFVDFNDMF